jgi:putative transposase
VVIEAEKANYKIVWMCRLLSVPRSSFYAWRNRVETPTAARRRELAAHVARAFQASRKTSGCRRVAAQLNRDGHECSVGMVADLMRELGLAAAQPRAYKRTTVPGEHPVDSPDLIGRDFTADAPGQRLVGDITYLKTGEGWLYLATVIDLATRMVVGWQLAAHMRTSLVLDALVMARDAGHLERDAIFHSDRGTQYTSAEFALFCKHNRIRTSDGRTGVCWDNAAAESFFASLKNEMYYRSTFTTRARARFAVADYIEVFYNRQRLHSTLGYRTRTKHSPSSEPQQPLHDQQPRNCPKFLTHLNNLIETPPRGQWSAQRGSGGDGATLGPGSVERNGRFDDRALSGGRA